jgi:uncharacterized protein
MFISDSLTIKNSLHKGRGVFAIKNIEANTIIETSPVLIIPIKEVGHAEKTMLYNYFFEWGKTKKQRALGMGYVSMYNHSYNSNCIYEMNYDTATISIITINNIKAGEEVFINYNADPNDETPIWFHKNIK